MDVVVGGARAVVDVDGDVTATIITTTIGCSDTSGVAETTSTPTLNTSTCVLLSSPTTATLPLASASGRRRPEVAAIGDVQSKKMSLPWDFSANELCRSCGAPQTELRQLFENHYSVSDDIDETNQNIIDTSSGGNGVEDPSDMTHTSTTSTNAAIQNRESSKMDIILREMQIWQLRVKQDDGLPQGICEKCTARFLMIGKFRQKCLKVQIRLRALNEERRLEEEQQLLKGLDDKKTLDIPPVLDIGNDLINDNYGQPLSEVELFETNWNAAETTQSESLTNELLVDDTVKVLRDNIVDDNGNDNNEIDELRTEQNITKGCSVLRGIDLEIKANIDEESLLDTHSLFKTTNVEKQTSSEHHEGPSPQVSALDINKIAPLNENKIADVNLVQNIADEYSTDDFNSSSSFYIKNTLDMLDTNNQSEDISASEKNNCIRNSVEVISIENLGKIDLLALMADKNGSDTTLFEHEGQDDSSRYIIDDNVNETSNVTPGQDKIELENTKTETTTVIESLNNEPHNLKGLDTTTNKAALGAKHISLQRKKLELTEPQAQGIKSTSDDCSLRRIAEMRRESRRHSDTTIITKAARKAYDPNLEKCEKISLGITKEVDTTENESKPAQNILMSSETSEIPILNDPKPALIIPYAQKRRKKISMKMKASSSLKQMSKFVPDTYVDVDSEPAAMSCAGQTRECSVRLKKLSSIQLNTLVLDEERDVSTTEGSQTTRVTMKRKNSNTEQQHSAHEVISSDNSVTRTADVEVQNDFHAENKIQKIESKKRTSWKTKAEMKATNDTNTMLRKTSLRRKDRTENKAAKDTSVLPHVDVEQHLLTNEITTVDIDDIDINMFELAAPKQNEQAKEQLKQFLLRKKTRESSKFQKDKPLVNEISMQLLAEKLQSNVNENPPIDKSEIALVVNKQITIFPPDCKITAPLPKREPLPSPRKQKSKQKLKPLSLRMKKVMQVQRWRLGLRKPKSNPPNDGNEVKKELNAVDASELKNETAGKETKPSVFIAPIESSKQKVIEQNKLPDKQIVIITQKSQTKDLHGNSDEDIHRTGLRRNIRCRKSLQIEDGNQQQLKVAGATGSDAQSPFNQEQLVCISSKGNPEQLFRSQESSVEDQLNTKQLPKTQEENHLQYISDKNLPSTKKTAINYEAQVSDDKATKYEKEQNFNETSKLIVRVPLAALTDEFQKLHFPSMRTKETMSNLTGLNVGVTETENTTQALMKSNFCEGAAASVECSEDAGAPVTDISIRASSSSNNNQVQPNIVVQSQNDSDLSDFYGFGSDTYSFEISSVGKDDENQNESIVSVSSQITDYINDFQTNCLTSNDIEDKSNTFPYEEVNTIAMSSEISPNEDSLNIQQIQVVRDRNPNLSSNVIENDVESTLNGILNEIQDQHIFASNTTLVTLESEDYHHHSSYSPLSDAHADLQISQNDFLLKTMKNTLCDSADSTGLVVDPRQVEGATTDANSSIMRGPSLYAEQFPKFDECFTEDSTQSELIGFQNDIPCFENIEMNSNSTPRQNPMTPPLNLLNQPSTSPSTSTPIRVTNSALQGAISHGKNVELAFKNSEGNIQYFGITTNEYGDDTMSLVCSTASGVPPIHTSVNINDRASQTLPVGACTNEQQTNVIAKEYIVDNTAVQPMQRYTEMHPPPQVRMSQTQDVAFAGSSGSAILLSNNNKRITLSPARSTKNSVLSKFVGSSKRLGYSKATEATIGGAENPLMQQTKKKLQFLTLANEGQSTSANAATVTTEISTLNLSNENVSTYSEILPQDVQWQTNAQDQQQTTYYINATDLQQSNLISALVNGNISLMSTSTTSSPQSTISIACTPKEHDSDKQQSVDANENYIEGMQNQSIMILFPQELYKDSTTLSPSSSDYNSSQNLTSLGTLPVLNAPSAAQSNALSGTASSNPSTSSATSSTLANAIAPPLEQPSVNLTCRFCHKRPKFTNNLEYSNHIIATHPAENPYNCPYCPMFFTKRVQRQQHVVEAHGSHRFQCAQCGQSFTMQRALDLHLQRIHVPDAQKQNLTKPRRKRLTREQKQLQLQQQQQIIDATPSCSSQQNYTRSDPTTTWQDNSSLNVQVSLEDVHLHVADDERAISEADNVETTTTQKLKTPQNRILGCPECDESFDDIEDAETHIHRMHSRSPPVTMPSPEQTEPDSTSTTTLRQFRKQRLSSKSSADTPERVLRSSHNCMYCDEHFTNEIALRKHHQMAHNNQAALPFVCSMCKRGFRMRTALQRHMDTHDSEGRPYECNVCRVRFPRPSQLTLHKLTVHFLKKPHTCNVCGRQFGTDSALKTHIKFHGEKQVSCSKCDKKFFLVKDFRKHWRIHTGELFYKCDLCPKSFVHYTRLSAHVKTHIPPGVYIEEDPPALIREQKKLQEQKQQQQSATENLKNSEVDNPQISS